jgi:outer membrane protein TolC
VQSRPLQEIPIPVDSEGLPARELELEDCVGLGLLWNTRLFENELVPRILAEDIRIAEAFFEPEFYAGGGVARTKSPSRSAFQPGTTAERYDATIGLRQRVITGGMFDLAFSPVRVEQRVNSTFEFPTKFYTAEWVATVTQPLLQGAWTDYALANTERAKIETSSAVNDREFLIQNTILAIVQAYWDLVFAREDYRVKRQSLDLAKEQLRIVEQKIRAGGLAERDRVTYEADVAQREEELIVAENQIRISEDALRRQILPFERRLETWNIHVVPVSRIEREDPPDLPPWEEAVRVAIERRPDLVRLRNDVDRSRLDLMQASRDLLPQLNLVGQYSSDGLRDSLSRASGDAFDREFPDYSVRLEMVVPIGNNAAGGRHDQAEMTLERTIRALHNRELDIHQEIRTALWNVEALAKKIEAGKETVRLRETNLDTQQSLLRVGRAIAFEVQQRNQELSEARSSLIRTRLDYRIALVRLRQVQGILGPDSRDL